MSTDIIFDGGFQLGRYSRVAIGSFFAVPHLPSGAFLTYLELDYCDTDPTWNVEPGLSDCDFLGESCNSLKDLSQGSEASGCHLVFADLTSLNDTLDNNSRQLVLFAGTQSTFAEMPTMHPYFRATEALAASGITSGCGGGNFCPNQAVTRGEMAKFLANAFGLFFPN